MLMLACHKYVLAVPGFAGIATVQPLPPVYDAFDAVAHVQVLLPLGFPGVLFAHWYRYTIAVCVPTVPVGAQTSPELVPLICDCEMSLPAINPK